MLACFGSQAVRKDLLAKPLTAEQLPPSYGHVLELQQQAVLATKPEVAWKWDVLRVAA